MKNGSNKANHITRGDVLDDLGFSRSEASALKVKAALFDAILGEIESHGYSQNQLVEILDEYQPSVSNLLRGKIAKVSLEKLLDYSDRLQLRSTLTVRTKGSARRTLRVASALQSRSRVKNGSVRRTAASVR